MASLVERYHWPPTVIAQQDLSLFQQAEALDVYKAFDHYKSDPGNLSEHEMAIVKPLQRTVERRIKRQERAARKAAKG